ncbi:MAG: TadE/TadG family type IV pilus assembly protein [Actinomycetota bacterium]|nr:pilus assembly protein [Actinomycetota bacterium]
MLRPRKKPCETGAASVEFAVVLPLVVVALLLLVQVALLVSQQLAVTHAAREGSRAAAVWNDDAKARNAALLAGHLESSQTDVIVEPSSRHVGDAVTVTVRYRPIIVVPYVGRFLSSSLELHASVTTRTERETS